MKHSNVCALLLTVFLSQGEDADTGGVDPSQRLFPPDAPILADVCR